MKIKCKYKPGDIRIIKRFLILPKTINGEIRWLEKVKIKQRFEYYIDVVIPLSEWTNIEWVN